MEPTIAPTRDILSNLPLELLQLLVTFLDKDDLLDLCLVSSLFRTLAQARLLASIHYQHLEEPLHLDFNADKCTQLVDSFARSPLLLQHVKSLHLWSQSQASFFQGIHDLLRQVVENGTAVMALDISIGDHENKGVYSYLHHVATLPGTAKWFSRLSRLHLIDVDNLVEALEIYNTAIYLEDFRLQGSDDMLSREWSIPRLTPHSKLQKLDLDALDTDTAILVINSGSSSLTYISVYAVKPTPSVTPLNPLLNIHKLRLYKDATAFLFLNLVRKTRQIPELDLSSRYPEIPDEIVHLLGAIKVLTCGAFGGDDYFKSPNEDSIFTARCRKFVNLFITKSFPSMQHLTVRNVPTVKAILPLLQPHVRQITLPIDSHAQFGALIAWLGTPSTMPSLSRLTQSTITIQIKEACFYEWFKYDLIRLFVHADIPDGMVLEVADEDGLIISSCK